MYGSGNDPLQLWSWKTVANNHETMVCAVCLTMFFFLIVLRGWWYKTHKQLCASKATNTYVKSYPDLRWIMAISGEYHFFHRLCNELRSILNERYFIDGIVTFVFIFDQQLFINSIVTNRQVIYIYTFIIYVTWIVFWKFQYIPLTLARS